MSNSHIYICDNTIEGLLSAVYESYYSADEVFDITTKENPQTNFVYEYKHISTNFDKAQKVAYAIKGKISRTAFDNIVKAWLSELPLSGYNILEYIRLGFKAGKDVNNILTQDNVAFIHSAVQKVDFEVNRFLGILRFSKTQDGAYVAAISPDHRILSLIADHFSQRLSNEKLAIYDEKRKCAILCDKGQWIIVNDINMKNQRFSQEEFLFRKMWQRYFNSVSIKERTNRKLQRSFIPVRYWKNITELKNEEH